MTWRRQPLCVLLLLAMLFSAVQAWAPAQNVTLADLSTPPSAQRSQETGTPSQKELNLIDGGAGIPEPVYPSSSATGPRPSSGPAPTTTSPLIYDYHGIQDAQSLGTPPYDGSGVRVSVLDYGLDMGHPDLNGSQFIQPNGTYKGWPVAFDAKSMGIWLRDKKYEGTWYGNTTRKGNGTFEVTHSILVDGRSDFGPSEVLGTEDPAGDYSGAPDGNKKDFDLTKLYVTHDEKFWYFAWPIMKFLNSNITYGLMIDVNNETGGTTSVPEGKLVNTNSTHSGTAQAQDDLGINDVAVSPDNTMVATTASDGHVKVWSLADGRRLLDVTHPSGYKPFTLTWSPNSTFLASRDSARVMVWNVRSGGALYYSFPILTTLPFDPDARYSSSMTFSPNGTWLAVGGDSRIQIFNVPLKSTYGHMNPGSGKMRSLAFNSSNPPVGQLVVGVDTYDVTSTNVVRIFNIDSSTVSPNPSPPKAASVWNSTGPAFYGHTGEILSVAWSPDGAKIVSTSKDNTVKLWAPPDTLPKMSSSLHNAWVTAASWERTVSSPRFVTVSKSVSPSAKAPLRVWDYNGNSAGYFDLNRTAYAVDWTQTGDLVTATLDLSARVWSTRGVLQNVLVANKPDFAVMVDAGLNYSLKDLKYVKVVHNGTFYQWNGGSWGTGNEVTKPPINGTQAFFGIDDLFVELGVPVSILGNPSGISAELFSVAQNKTHAQDTSPIDYNVFDINGDGKTDKGLDWTPVELALSDFQYVPVRYYRTNTAQIPSASGTYHFGYHPSQQLAQVFGSLGILVVDPVMADNYTRVYIDMDRNTCDSNKIFDARDVWVDKTHPVATCNKRGDPTQDISAGMIYFIADGVNYLPYSERFKTLNGIDENKKPGNGELVAFAGEFKLDPNTNEPIIHGTQVASIIASRGLINPATMRGIAPATKLIPVLNALDDVVSSWYFAVEGYDGSTGTGDEAQIVLSPFEYPRTRDDGFDSFSRSADYLSTSYSAGRTVFFGPAGEEGFGYGTVASPAASPGVITVGRTVDGSLLSSLYGGVEGPSVHYDTIAFRSSRGPTVPGFPKPDLVAIGNTAVDVPLLKVTDGTQAFEAFGITGSEVSAAIAAGVGALLMDAAARTGRTLTAGDVRNYLMSGAENLGYDILQQGAGFLNASRSMRLLLGGKPQASVHVSPPSWVPGTYKGAKPEAFTRLLLPGQSDQTTFTLANRDTSSLSLALSGDVLTKWDGYGFTNRTIQAFRNDIFLWVNRSGVFVPDPVTFAPIMIAPPISPDVWNNSEMVKVSAYSDFDKMIVPSGTDQFAVLSCYDIVLMDWTWAGSINGYPTASFNWELNTLDELLQTANVIEGRVQRPGKNIHDALVMKLRGHLEQDSCRKLNLEWRFEVDFYQRLQWNWLSLDKTSVSINAGATTTVLATMAIPSNAPMGSYEGAIYVTDAANKHELTTPVLVNVGSMSPNFRFGGNLPVTGLLDVNRIYGGRDMTLSGANVRYYYLGDWRYFYLFLPDQGLNIAGASIKMVVQLNWTVKPSDIDLAAFTTASAADLASGGDSTRFGPKSLREATASEVEPKPKFKTLSNTTQDYISFSLVGGLNVIGLHEMILNGDNPYETFWGSGMWWTVPREVRKATQSLAGSVQGFAMTSAALYGGLRASAVGPAISSLNTSVLIKQDWQDWMRSLSWGQALAKGSYTYCIQVKKALILDIHLMGLPDVNDLDLGMFIDQNDDCKLDEATETVGAFCTGLSCTGSAATWAYDADGDADEHIRWTNPPPDKNYIIKVLGFDVPGGQGHFNLEVQQTLDTGTGYTILEAPKPEEIVIGTAPVLTAFRRVNFSMVWDFPGDQDDGNYSGAIQLGTASAPGIIVVPAVVILDRLAPSIVSFKVESSNLLVNNTNPNLTNDPMPSLIVTIRDTQMGSLDTKTFRMVLDGKDVSADMKATVALETSPFALTGTTGPWGFWRGDMKYDPLYPLSNDYHFLYVAIADEARNYLHQNFSFKVDMLSPPLSLAGAGVEYTRSSTFVMQGKTEGNAYVQVGGQWLRTDASGQFSVPVNLGAGKNPLDVTATRWFSLQQGVQKPANPVTIQKLVVYDTIAPTILGRSAEPSGSYVNVNTVRLTGQVSDEIATGTLLNAWNLTVKVNGVKVSVMPDGTFSTVVPLQEGQNSIVIYVEDPAGNNATGAPLVIVMDTTAPVLQVVGVPDRVETDSVTVTVRSEDRLTVKINGFDAPENPSGTYTKTVLLSPGSNAIVIRAEDGAKNSVETRVNVVYAAPSGLGRTLFGPAGGAGAIAFMVALVVVIVVVVFFLMRWMRGRGEEEEGGEVAAEEELKAEEEIGAEPHPEEETEHADRHLHEIVGGAPEPEVKPPVERPTEKPTAAAPTPTLVVFRVTRSKRAFDEGKISRNVYEQNLASMGLSVAEADKILEEAGKADEAEARMVQPSPTVPAAPPAAAPPSGPEVKAARLKGAYEAGKIPKDVYVQNLKALGLAVPPELEQPSPEKKGPTKEDKMKALRKALDEGRISQEVYEENVRKLQES